MIEIFGKTAKENVMERLTLNLLKFPGGEMHVTVQPDVAVDELRVTCLCKSADSVMALLLVTDALKRAYSGVPITLELPYVPYARQDRVANPGEALSIAVFAKLINSQGYRKVVITDPHSAVTPALLDNVEVLDITESISRIVAGRTVGNPLVLVAPDAGAHKRVQKIASTLGLDMITADKVRDTKTGQITGMQVPSSLPDAPLLVVDDICDGGRTFIELAEALNTAYSRMGRTPDLSLYVTHGIFSKGIAPLLTYYNNIYARYDWTLSSDCIAV